MHSMPCIIPLHTYGKYHSSILKLAIFGPLSIHPNKVDVPVDDVLCVTKCSNKTIAANATINLFMESNKLKLSA